MNRQDKEFLLPSRVLEAPVTQAGTPGPTQIDAQFVINAIRRKAKFIIVSTLLGVVLTGTVLELRTPNFTATSTLFLRSEGPEILTDNASSRGEVDTPQFVDSQISMLRSKRIANIVVEGLSNEERSEILDHAGLQGWLNSLVSSFATSIFGQLSGLFTRDVPEGAVAPGQIGPETQTTLNKQLLIEAYLERLEIKRQERSYVLEVSFTDDSPVQAAKKANAFVEAYLSDKVASKVAANRAAQRRIGQELATLAKDIQKREQLVQDFRVTNKILNDGDQRLEQRQLMDSAIELVSLREKIGAAEKRLEEISSSSNREGMGSNTAEALVRDIGRLKALEEAELNRGTKRIELREKERQLAVAHELHSNLFRRHKEIQAEVANINSGAFILTRAFPPFRTSGTSRIIILAATSFLWLALATFAAPAMELSRRTLLTRSDVERTFGLSCVAEIPIVSQLPPTNVTGCIDGSCSARHADIDAPIYWNMDEEAQEAFSQQIFRLKHWVENVSRHSKPILLVVSPNRGEGRSTISVQIARFAAASRMKVLLVDGDLRTAALTATLGLSHARDELNVSAKVNPVEKNLQTIKCENFAVCPAPAGEELRPLNLLESAVMHRSLIAAREDYDLIVIDTPPMLDYSDALALMDIADAAIIVVRHARTKKSEVREVIRQLEATELPKAALALMAVPSPNVGR